MASPAAATPSRLPAGTAVLLDHTRGEAWFVGLRLQPRPAWVDGPAIRARLEEAGEPYVVVHLQRVGDRTWWWFDPVEEVGPRRVGSPPPLVLRDGFENGLGRWTAVGTRTGP